MHTRALRPLLFCGSLAALFTVSSCCDGVVVPEPGSSENDPIESEDEGNTPNPDDEDGPGKETETGGPDEGETDTPEGDETTGEGEGGEGDDEATTGAGDSGELPDPEPDTSDWAMLIGSIKDNEGKPRTGGSMFVYTEDVFDFITVDPDGNFVSSSKPLAPGSYRWTLFAGGNGRSGAFGHLEIPELGDKSKDGDGSRAIDFEIPPILAPDTPHDTQLENGKSVEASGDKLRVQVNADNLDWRQAFPPAEPGSAPTFSIGRVPMDKIEFEGQRIKGYRNVAAWAFSPFRIMHLEEHSAPFVIEDDLGLEEGTKVIAKEWGDEPGGNTIGEAVVKDGKIDFGDQGIRTFSWLYILVEE